MSTTNTETVQKVNDAFNQGNIDAFLDCCTPDVQWTIVGSKALAGQDAIRQFMNGDASPNSPAITTTNIIANGDFAACEGSFTLKKKDGGTYHAAFCDVYRFNGEKIGEMRSYVIDLKQ